jgi:ADP-heptose:LPS heptosyltransferase
MKIFLKQNQSPGDILMLTAAVRDLKRSFPDFHINCRTSAQ